jgi:4-diphosphocytidyl-2-C-methyl-D-erythritol kinase
MMNKILGAGLQENELISMAGALGSDCPFFILNRPAQATGRGEILKEIDISLGRQEVILVLPGIHVSTSWAYSHIIPHRHEIPPSELVAMDIHLWKEYLVNDFETPVFKEYPQLRDARDHLYDLGAVYASMSGSGSSVYGIFNTAPPRIESEFGGMKVLRTTLLA